MSESVAPPTLLKLTARIVAAHAAHNQVTPEALLQLIGAVHGALAGAGQQPVEEVRPEPALPVKRSVFPDHIVCLEDGKKLKMLKRHLMTTYRMTPEQYRAKWNLPASYPMVAPEYAARRSTLAKKIGLGHKPVARPKAAKASAPAKRGRRTAAEAAD
ncbi:MAG: MucR family transcriptional regulator [Rhodospirillales bacterium]|nr:MucR family transcriptional regulator [Rhodospirillales bacterium]